MKALKCDMCGAPLHIQKSIVKFDKNYNSTIIPIGYRCEYCGTEYSSSPYVNLEMNDVVAGHQALFAHFTKLAHNHYLHGELVIW